jgi:hypothetical protein
VTPLPGNGGRAGAGEEGGLVESTAADPDGLTTARIIFLAVLGLGRAVRTLLARAGTWDD